MIGNMTSWPAFLEQWSTEILGIVRAAPKALQDALVASSLERGTILREPASADQVRAAEERLGVALPGSVKRFYEASNGLTLIAFDAVSNELWPVEGISRFVDNEPGFVADWEAETRPVPDEVYFDYGPRQSSAAIRVDYLRTMWQLSPFVDAAVLLLNPNVIDERGEWEAWFLGVSLPGARRFRGFEELMMYVRTMTVKSARGAVEAKTTRS